jgi:ribosomal subunit interface protein
MRHNIEFKHFEPHERIRNLVEELIARLEKYVKDFPEETVFLRALIEENAVRKLYHVTITLDLPGRILAAKVERHDIDEAVRAAFTEIERQIEKHKATLRGEQFWKRRARREEIRRMKVEGTSPEERNRELFNSIIEQHLKKLYNFVRREIAYYQSTGDLPPGYLSPEDVVDTTVLRAYDEFPKRPTDLPIDHWLIKLAIEQLESEIKRVKAERESVTYVGEVIPEVPLAKEVLTRPDEIRDTYHPEKDLKLEKIVPVIQLPLPNDVAQSRELQSYVNRSLASLPKLWRRAFVLHYGEGLTVPEVAKVTGMTEVEVSRYLEYAREYLRQKIMQSGLAVKESGEDQSETEVRRVAR